MKLLDVSRAEVRATLENNIQVNHNADLNIGAGRVDTLKAKNSDSKVEKHISKTNKNAVNLPSINKNLENSAKIDHSLVGFATRSLSKNGSLKIKKAAAESAQTKSQINLKSKPMPESKHGFNKNSHLINVPKKYQFRGKRLNIDSQSISSSKNSKGTSESIKQRVFHTKSGPIHANDALSAQINNKKTFNNPRKNKLVDYQPKNASSPGKSDFK